MVNNTLPGEEAQVDFGYIGKIPDPTGKFKKAWVFCMILCYSRLMYCEIVFNQEVETFIRCHENAFKYFGGVPKVVKIDNLKAAILEANFYEPIYQREYKEFGKYHCFSSIPCRVKTPTDKAKIESGVKYVKNNFFKGRSLKTYEEYTDKLFKIYSNYELIATHLKIEGKGQFLSDTAHYPDYKVKTKTQLQLEYRQKM